IYQITIAVCFKVSRNTHFLANTNMPISAYYFPIVFSHSGILFRYFLNIHSFKKEVLFYKVKVLFLFICLYLFYEMITKKLAVFVGLFIKRQEANRFL